MGEDHEGVTRRTTIKGIAAGGAIGWAAPQILTTPAAHAQSAPATPCDCPQPSYAWGSAPSPDTILPGSPVTFAGDHILGPSVSGGGAIFFLAVAGTYRVSAMIRALSIITPTGTASIMRNSNPVGFTLNFGSTATTETVELVIQTAVGDAISLANTGGGVLVQSRASFLIQQLA